MTIEIDETTDFGARAAAHLRDDVIVWLTSVAPSGAPLPTPVWFLWDGASGLRIQSLPTAKRAAHLQANPHVSLNFEGDGVGGDVVVLSGRATVKTAEPQLDGYVEKYRDRMEAIGLTPEQFGARYSTVLDIELTRLRGH
ncbi:TIGR03667 family PPOX class F420-dependent oxidoreductase [Baekduia alba]|uniref:TIGR03667 family PPOX class F420-dependent oxidoreductase n=1 Tax=Baekduia alba TaxID=2997333 RepID=UPI0023424AAB|nr:TIGR03667 family PPOX class F420-dependent oxidoreductase [Baekduia alba]